MGVIQLMVALPLGLLVIALVHDFMAGLGEERVWGLPLIDGDDLTLAPPPARTLPGPAESPAVALRKAG